VSISVPPRNPKLRRNMTDTSTTNVDVLEAAQKLGEQLV
jgi:hypothetical protein